MTMSERKPIPKGLRFKIFERDSFTCQYCGRTVPEVILEVDHVLPVCEGGLDLPDNLISACQDCNRGKSGKVIGPPATDLAARTEELREKEEQIEAYRQILAHKSERIHREVEWLQTGFAHYMDLQLWPTARATLRQMLERLPAHELMTCIEISAVNCEAQGIWKQDRQFRYFCGVVRGREERRRQGRE